MKSNSTFALATVTAAVQLGQQNNDQIVPFDKTYWPHQIAIISAYCDAMDRSWDGNWSPVFFRFMLDTANAWQIRNMLDSEYPSIPQDFIDSVPQYFDDDFNKKVEKDLSGDLGKRYDKASLQAWYFIEQIAKDKETSEIVINSLVRYLTDVDTMYYDAPLPIWDYPIQKQYDQGRAVESYIEYKHFDYRVLDKYMKEHQGEDPLKDRIAGYMMESFRTIVVLAEERVENGKLMLAGLPEA